MAFTSITQLTRESGTNTLINGEGFFQKGHTFFYAEDIQKVLGQAEDPNELKLSQLRIVNIVFKKDHGLGNHNIHSVTGLALAKLDEQGNVSDTDWYDKVALAWPPYYKAGSVTGLTNQDEGSEFFGHPFEGHDDYTPGFEIHK